MEALYTHPDLGRIFVPRAFNQSLSLAGRPTAPRRSLREIGIFVAVQKRFNLDKQKWEMLWASITHNERVDIGASIQANRVFGTVGTVSAGVPANIAIANATLTKTKTDLGLGQATGGATITNEFSTIGLARALGTVQNYVLPATLGGTFATDVVKTFTASGSGTAYGAGLFDSVTPTGSHLYCEDNFGSTAVLISGDTLAVTITVNN